jgi:hypothetical protein
VSKQRFNTLKLERNVARAPIWLPRSGLPLTHAAGWPDVPFNGNTFRVAQLSGTLGPTDLLVFARVCTLYAATKPSDRRVELSLADIGRWTGNVSLGGSQQRAAIACLNRLLGARFNSSVRFGSKGSERYIHGWGLIDEWLMPDRGRHVGAVRISNAVAELLAAGSVVLLDAATLQRLVRRSGLAARLWVFLEADTLRETGLTARGQPYPLYSARPGEPPRMKHARPALVDLCRVTDPRRRRVVALLRRACEAIQETDSRYRLSIEPAGSGRESMWVLWARRWRTPAPLGRLELWADLASPLPIKDVDDGGQIVDESQRDTTAASWGTRAGMLGGGNGASRGTDAGILGDAATVDVGTEAPSDTVAGGASWGTEPSSPRRATPDAVQDGLLQTMPVNRPFAGADARKDLSASDEAAISRDRAILEDPESPPWKREVALVHLAQLKVEL